MPLLVHLSPEKCIGQIKRDGLKGRRGVYCMPVLPDYYVSHQWLRELKRRGQRTLLGVYFRVSAQEVVAVGRYNQPHQLLPLGDAIRCITDATDPQGYEIILQRPIAAEEIHRICAVSHNVGWRYSPGSHARAWCNCRGCISPGEINSRKKRADDR